MASEVTTIFVDLVARDKASKSLAKSALALGAIGFAVTKFAKDSVKAYEEAQNAQDKLSFAYNKFNKLHDVSERSLSDLASALQKTTVYDDEATRAAEAHLAVFGLTGKQMEKLIPLVQDYASVQGITLEDAATNVGRALVGQARALKSIGIEFHKTGDRVADVNTLMGDLSQTVGGFAERQGKTAAGQVEILKNQFNDLQESVGGALVPALQSLVHVATPLVESFNKLPDPTKTFAVALVGIGAAALIVIPKIVLIKRSLAELPNGMRGAISGFGKLATAIGLVTAAGIALNSSTGGGLGASAESVDKLANSAHDLKFQFDNAFGTGGGFTNVLNGIDAFGRGLVGATSYIDAGKASMAGLDHELAQLVQGGNFDKAGDLWNKIKAAAEGSGLSINDLKKLFPEYSSALDALTVKTDENTGAVKGQQKAYKDVLAAYDAYIGRLEGGKRAQIAAREANRSALQAIKDLGKGSKQSAADVDTAFTAILDAADAAAAGVQGAHNKDVAYRAELVKLRDHVKKGSPLYVSLSDYIKKLGDIPAKKTTQVTLDFGAVYSASIAAGQSAALISHLGASTHPGSGSNIDPKTGRILNAEGGYYPYRPGGWPVTVGEAGDEVIIPTKKLAAGMSGGGINVNVYVEGSVHSDQSLAIAVKRAFTSTGIRGTS